ncbi:hypothetical protein RTG_02974 [Rhodotorula toruloides ATCC 204091]|uniref:Sad1 / UNC-like C-terminal-domain containing protein n=1 Tax=Rhodotorula toruloides TaxID=5286 RepID=A0A0K3CIH2_RHOTO|nr:hypothetical protein RTG_02974 [Rhodotorula toruloides ATCC 204091]PRQ72143.1 Sad1 / UNC-like C-terminal-domain containing protein [Rhodotorula toruloides]
MTVSTATEGVGGTASASQATATPTETPTQLPTTSSTPSPSSDSSLPPAAEPSSPPPPEPSPSVLPDLPVVEELPLTEVPPAPEFLSFNEWRERYAVAADPSVARRAKKAAQRARQDVVGASASGANGAAYDGDGADLGSLFVGGDEAGSKVGDRLVFQDIGSVPGVQVGVIDVIETDSIAVTPTSDMANPIQPLPDVGTGEPNDPLLLLKDRSNYAAFECAAMVHRSSRQSKGASAILVEKKDRYMLTPCSANPKFVDVELCDEIQIDTLVLANFEFFSSTFKHFKASCSVDYPGKPADWHDLGTFRARNVRGIQVFKPIRNPHFCRYLRIDFLSHFGSEFYCPVSVLRVYGYTQLDAYRESERKAKAIEEALAAAELIEEEVAQHERVLEDALRVEVDKLERLEDAGAKTVNATVEITPSPSTVPPIAESGSPSPAPSSSASSPSNVSKLSQAVPSPLSVATSQPLPTASTEYSPSSTLSSTTAPPAATTSPIEADTHTTSSATPFSTVAASTDTSDSASSATVDVAEPASSSNTATSSATRIEPSSSSSIAVTPVSTLSPSSSSPTAEVPTSSNSSVPDATPNPLSGRPVTPSDIPVVISRPPPAPRNDTHSASQPHVPLPPPSRPPVIQPTQPGESIYGTIMKRLTSLEHNQTLAMHFIEAQSSMLREAFGRIERRLTDIEGSRGRQEQSIRQALLDLEQQRVELERERLALSTQVSKLTQEVRLEKRLTVAQLIGLLLLVIFVGFTRGIPTSPFLHLASTHLDTKRETKRTQADLLADRLGEAVGSRLQTEAVDEGEYRILVSAAESSTNAPHLADAPAAPRRGHRISPSVSLSRYNGTSSAFKRYPSISKAGPRRHYGIGSSKATNGKGDSSRARPWSPPTRHASAPPEEPPAMILDGKAAKRRRPLADLAGSDGHAFEFPARSSSTQPSSTSAVGSIATGAASSSASLSPIPFPSTSLSSPAPTFSPSAAPHPQLDLPINLGYLSTSLGPPAERSDSAFSPASTNGFVGDDERDEGGYHTYSSDEEALASVFPSRTPSRDQMRAAALASSSPSSPGTTASPRIRPPKPQVPLRPATSMGFRDERATQKDKSRRTSRGPEAKQAANSDDLPPLGPAPTISTPSPPPETPAPSSLVQHKRSDTLA